MNQQNVDPQEIHKFDQMAEDWWNPQGSMKPLHLLNPVRMDFIQQKVDLKHKHVIDVGCGGGILTEALAKADAQAVGIDLSTAALEVARQHAKTNQLNIDYQLTAVETLASTQANTFDVVTCLEMLEHVPNPAQTIQACAQLVKPQGYVFFSTLHRNPKSFLLAIIAAEYLLKMLPKGTHNYASFIKPSELNTWAETAGLKLVDLCGLHYSPWRGKFTLNNDLSVNYLACYQKEAPLLQTYSTLLIS